MSRRTNDKNQQILKALLKEPGNGHCADCKTATHPRWASWNLGIFICIRCSGIHRSMGTHISRVKSVDLDTWTDEQVTSMVKWGNNRANKFWESKLPGNSHVPDGSKIENFIRTKYEMKKWAASSQVPDPSTISLDGTASSSVSPAPAATAAKSTQQQENRRSLNSTLLDLEFGSPIAAPTASTNARSTNISTHSLPQSISPQPQLPQQASAFPQPPQAQAQRDNSRPELKKSILSLYSTPMASTSTPNFPTRTNTSTPSSQSMQSSSSTLAGLNFGNSYAQPQQTYAAPQQNFQNNWGSNNTMNSSNVWASAGAASTQTTQQTGKSALDDDLFKNVWN